MSAPEIMTRERLLKDFSATVRDEAMGFIAVTFNKNVGGIIEAQSFAACSDEEVVIGIARLLNYLEGSISKNPPTARRDAQLHQIARARKALDLDRLKVERARFDA